MASTVTGLGCAPGCTDSTANNYDSTATQNDGSCVYANSSNPNGSSG